MSRAVKVLLVLTVLGLVLPFFLKDRAGKPLLSWERLRPPKVHLPAMPDMKGLARTAGDKIEEMLPERPATMYKWRDAKGTLVLSDRPNPDGPSEAVRVNPKANLIPPVHPAPAANPPASAQKPAAGLPQRPSLTSIPVEKIPELIDQARELGAMATQRNAEQGRQTPP